MSSGVNWDFDASIDVSTDGDGSATVTPGLAWASGRNQEVRLAVLFMGFREFVDEGSLPGKGDILLGPEIPALKFNITLSHFKDKGEWADLLVERHPTADISTLVLGNSPPNDRNRIALVEEIERINDRLMAI